MVAFAKCESLSACRRGRCIIQELERALIGGNAPEDVGSVARGERDVSAEVETVLARRISLQMFDRVGTAESEVAIRSRSLPGQF